MAITNSTLTDSGVDFYISSGQTAMVVVYICNTSAAEVTLQIHAIPSGDGQEPVNTLYKNLKIPSHDTFIIDNEKIIFENGDKLMGIIDAGDGVVVTTVSYVGI